MAIKNWFLEKQGWSIGTIKEFQKNGYQVEKETEKAVLISYHIWSTKVESMWVPKSCLCDEWEHKYTPKAIGSAYHSYLVNTIRQAYESGNLGEKRTFTSGRNVYSRVAFRHQWSSQDLIDELNEYNVQYMTKAEFAKTL